MPLVVSRPQSSRLRTPSASSVHPSVSVFSRATKCASRRCVATARPPSCVRPPWPRPAPASVSHISVAVASPAAVVNRSLKRAQGRLRLAATSCRRKAPAPSLGARCSPPHSVERVSSSSPSCGGRRHSSPCRQPIAMSWWSQVVMCNVVLGPYVGVALVWSPRHGVGGPQRPLGASSSRRRRPRRTTRGGRASGLPRPRRLADGRRLVSSTMRVCV